MEKTIVSLDYLLSWINYEIAKYDACNDCKIISIILTEQDEDGNNWSDAELRCSGVPTDDCRHIAQRIIKEAREIFNVG